MPEIIGSSTILVKPTFRVPSVTGTETVRTSAVERPASPATSSREMAVLPSRETSKTRWPAWRKIASLKWSRTSYVASQGTFTWYPDMPQRCVW